ncbi:MAG: pseudouridine synthase [Candidatus Komeilibacteria bacterium]
MIRLAKFLALAGIASRREAEQLITAGKVLVNGKPHLELGRPIDENRDVVVFRGQPVRAEAKVYYLVHKPIGYLSANKDSYTDLVVTKLVPIQPKVYPVGRLDKDSSGLMLLTNDGDLTYQLTHPKFAVEKEYEVTTDKPVTAALLADLKKGVKLAEGLAVIDNGKIIGPKKFSLTLHQGWNRQIRRMLGHLGIGVVGLVRVREGNLKLGSLPVGKYKKITQPHL